MKRKRVRVFIQVKDQSTGRWHNHTSYSTYDEAVQSLKELQSKYKEAILRVRDDNLITHTKIKTK